MGSEEALFDVLRLFSTLHANITGRGGSTGLDSASSLHVLDGAQGVDVTRVAGGIIDRPGSITALDMSAAAQRAAKADALASAAVESLRGMMVKECTVKVRVPSGTFCNRYRDRIFTLFQPPRADTLECVG